MANTGYIIYTYKDTNPYSETYNQTREERVYDTELCPIVTDFDYIMRIFVNGTQTEQVDCNEVINTIDRKMVNNLKTKEPYDVILGNCAEDLADGTLNAPWSGNTYIKSIDFSHSQIQQIPENCFYNATNLETVVFGSGKIQNGIMISAFFGCQNLKGTVEIPYGCEIISQEAFRDCFYYNEGEVILPETITAISARAFGYCKYLKSVTLFNPTPFVCGTDAFLHNYAGVEPFPIYVPDESVNRYKSMTNWKQYRDRIKPLSEKE